MFFNVVILNFISMITTPYVFQRCDFDLLDLIDDGCKKPHGVFCNQKNRCKKPLGFFATGVFCNRN